jgi:ATP-dependent DNA helicase RecG
LDAADTCTAAPTRSRQSGTTMGTAGRSVRLPVLPAHAEEARWVALLDDLRKLPAETNWVEFKADNVDPDRIGRTAAALANGARLSDQPFGYMVWGIEDGTHRVIGTSFEPLRARRGNDVLEFWLARRLDPSPALAFRTVFHPEGRVVLLEIPAAIHAPVKFSGIPYVRIGDATPPLADYPERERVLWTKLQPTMWERGIAAQFVTSDIVLEWID